VADVDPWSDNVLIRQGFDLWEARWWLFDLERETLRDIGPARDYGLFLATDVLGHAGRTR
jgi:hypothetical protein